MARTAPLVLVAGLVMGAVAIAFLVLRGPSPVATPPPMEVIGPTPTEQALREEIARLQARLARFEETARQPIDAGKSPRTAQPPAAAAPAEAPPEAGAVAAAAWLRQAQPERFGNLTGAEARYLRELELRGKQLTDADLRNLAGLVSLRQLVLRGQPVTDAGVAQLAALEQLESLELRGTAVTGSAFSQLPAGLTNLDLTDSQVRSEELGHLARLQRLRTLDLNRLELGDADVEAIGRCSSVRHLELDGTGITDQGVRRLLELNPDLERLEVRSTPVSAALIAELRQRFPRLVIVNDSPLARR